MKKRVKKKLFLWSVVFLILVALVLGITYLAISFRQIYQQNQDLEKTIQQLQAIPTPTSVPVVTKPASQYNLDEVCRQKANAFEKVFKNSYSPEQVAGLKETLFLECRYP